VLLIRCGIDGEVVAAFVTAETPLAQTVLRELAYAPWKSLHSLFAVEVGFVLNANLVVAADIPFDLPLDVLINVLAESLLVEVEIKPRRQIAARIVPWLC